MHEMAKAEQVIEKYAVGPGIFVGHSVGAMIGVLAGLTAPEKFAAQVCRTFDVLHQ